MVKIAFVFPGQGSQYVGMAKDFHDQSSEARHLFEEAAEAIGEDLTPVCFDGPEETLKLTKNVQPAILIHSIIALNLLRENGINSVLAAGHSLGEYSALVSAGALKFRDAVRLVRMRGEFMQEAVPVGVGAMAAVIGLEADEVVKLCQDTTRSDAVVEPANLNSPGQIVIAGHTQAVETVAQACKEKGAKRTVMLPVSAPFHCSLMKPAETRLEVELNKTDFQDLSFPVITNIEARPNSSGEYSRMALTKQVCSPVQWADTMKVINDSGVRVVVELGPGKVLSGLMRRFNKDIQCLNVEDMASLQKTMAAIKDIQSQAAN